MAYQELIQELVAAAKTPKKTVIKTMKETGKRAVGMFPVFAPDELVYAAGCIPVGMWGGHTEFELADKYLQSFCCSLVRANMEYGLKGDYNMLSAVVANSFCDALKGLYKNWPYGIRNIPIIPCIYPQNTYPEAQIYLTEELQYFQKNLEKCLKVKITEEDILNAVDVYDAYRDACRRFVEIVKDYPVTLDAKTRHFILKAAQFMDKKVYTEKLTAIVDGLLAQPKEEKDGLRVVLTGVMIDAESYLDVLVKNNIIVVADDLMQESRQFRTANVKSGTGVKRIADRYCQVKGCAMVYDEQKTRGDLLIDLKNRYGADAIVYALFKFCEIEEFDYPVIKEQMEKEDVKMLYIESDQQVESPGQLENRIQAFVEINQ